MNKQTRRIKTKIRKRMIEKNNMTEKKKKQTKETKKEEEEREEGELKKQN